ncbi:3'(2'),5'-bisphosphate nucleotidase CysQ [Oleiphilus sp. HI0009]|nr:3'(2'),5'-bisphosphate nucleotidase CysQ [Oleiphilus sp. HI0009]
MSDLSAFFEPLSVIAKDAGKAILEVYNSDFPIEIDTKSDDSPVTKADLAAHKIIEKGLQALTPDIPFLSEEGGLPEYTERKHWQRYWLVDPLDGTKEFINKNGEFTVNIAFIENHEPALGLVYVPVTDTLYLGGLAFGSFKNSAGLHEQIAIKPVNLGTTLTVVGSRRHGAEALDSLLEKVSDTFSNIDRVDMGSSLKICACAEGSADWYPRLALTCEWDTAAAHAVLKGAGGEIYTPELTPLRYNTKEEMLNPFFHAVGDTSFDWKKFL